MGKIRHGNQTLLKTDTGIWQVEYNADNRPATFTKNVTELYNTNGTIATAYDCTPFGQVTASGTADQPIQWSSEYNDTELGLVYYNYRHYNPQDGRWINRDPIAEQGGWNLYGFVGNNGVNDVDFFGYRKIKMGLYWDVTKDNEKCGEINVDEYQMNPEILGNDRKSIIGQILITVVFYPAAIDENKKICCCKDGDIRWISRVTKDTAPNAPKTPYLDLSPNQVGPYYDPSGGDGKQKERYMFRDTPLVPGWQLATKKANGENTQIDVEFKTQLVCASEHNKVLTDFEWGFSYFSSGKGGTVERGGFIYLDTKNIFNILLK